MKTSSLIIIWILLLIVFLSYRWFLNQPDQIIDIPTVPQSSQEPAPSPAPVSPQQKQLKHSPLPEQVKQPSPVKSTRLNIRLLGTVVAGKSSSVIVLLPGNSEQRNFKLGDFIQPGVRLHHVDADAMVVERNGKLKSVRREYSKGLNSAGGANSDADTHISTLMTRARLELHQNGGKTDGFLISNIVVSSLYHKIGLNNGDIIRKINDTQLLSAHQMDVFYKTLSSTSSFELEIMRAGQLKQLSYAAK